MSWNYCMKCISVLPILLYSIATYVRAGYLMMMLYDYIYTCSTFGAVYGMGRTLSVKFKFWWTMWSQCEEFKAWFYNYTSLHGYIYRSLNFINCTWALIADYIYLKAYAAILGWYVPSLILYRKKNQPLYSIYKYMYMSLFVKKKRFKF